MEKFFVEINGLKPFVQALGLVWPVEYFFVPTENTCRVTSDPSACRHEVWVHPGVIQNPETYLCDLVHELCHASLAERVDVAFSTIYFSRHYAHLSSKAEKEFAKKYWLLYLAWAHVDVWVDELRHSLFPDLTFADHDSFFKSISVIASLDKNELVGLEQPQHLLALAVHLAETKRFGLAKQDFSQILNCLSREGQKTVSRMHQYYAILPRLTFQPEKDLAILLDSVQKAAKKLGLPIAPRILEEEGRQVWLV